MSASTVTVCFEWSRPDEDHARGLCANQLKLETPAEEASDENLACVLCVRPQEPQRVGGCRQCGEFNENDQLVKYVGQASGDQALPKLIHFALDGSISGAVAQQLIEQDLPRVHNLGRAGKRYLYTPVLQPSAIKTSGTLKQLSAFAGLAGNAFTLGAQIITRAASAEAAETLIQNDGSCIWGMGEYWTHVRATVGPRKMTFTSFAMLTDNIIFNCEWVPPGGLGIGGYYRLASNSRPVANFPPANNGGIATPGVIVSQTGQSITGFEGGVRIDPETWKWPEEAGDLFALASMQISTSTASLMFPYWRSGTDIFGQSGMNNSALVTFPVDAANYYQDGNFYDYIADLVGESISVDYVGAGDSLWTTGGKQHYWSTGDPFDPAYYNQKCRVQWSHRRTMRTGKAAVGYRWNLFHFYTSDPTSVTIPGGGGYGTLLKLSIQTPITNTTSTKTALWTWCDVTRPGYGSAVLWGGPSLQDTDDRWASGATGECATQPPIGYYLNHQVATVTPTTPGCLKWTRNDPASVLEFGVTGCCQIWFINGSGPETQIRSWDSQWNQVLYGYCERRIPNAQTTAIWNACVAETIKSTGLLFWGYDQLNPPVDFKSEWVNWIDTTPAEDSAVMAQLGSIGKLPANNAVKYPFVDNTTLAIYKVTKSLAHCDREAFDLKLIWARTEAFGVTFGGPKLVPSSYPTTGSIYWD